MCKLEHYGNCDPETKDQEYCIFHKPNKTKEEAKKFWRKFLEKFCPKTKPKDEVKLDRKFTTDIEFFIFDNVVEIIKKVKYFIFDNKINCRGFRFPDFEFPLERAIFKESVDFSEAVFEGDAKFNKVIFKMEARFVGAIFGNAEFRETCFENVADFSNAKFECADFTYAKFKGEDNRFDGAVFGRAYFGEAEFENFAWFIGTKFGYALFNFAKFGKYANFSMVRFMDNAEFQYSTFRGLAEFIGTEFRGNVTFEGAEFLGEVSFKHDSKRVYAKFLGRLSFLNANFRKGISIDLPKECFRLPQAEAEACRVQRIWYEKEGNKDKADEMFVRERQALRRAKVRQAKEQLDESKGIKSKLKAIWNLFKAYASASIEYLLADLTCKYGTNWKRPVVIWIFTVLMLFPLLYLLTKSVPNAYDFLSCLYFSIVTATTLGYGDLHSIGVGRALASAEAIFGTFMWAVFLAVFARKYMR